MKTSTTNVELYPVEPGDEEFLYRVYASTGQEELAQTGRSETQKETFLRQQFAPQSRYYWDHYSAASFEVILADGYPIKPLSIHVERFNPALRHYGRLGFREVSDKGVYLLMERTPGMS